MPETRKQLTLFLESSQEAIEKIRASHNPEQFKLISAHVTLCREDEIQQLSEIIENIKAVRLPKPLCLEFDRIRRFSDGRGALLPSKGNNLEFHELRKALLKGISEPPRDHEPHITLMHPRNSSCSAELFSELRQVPLPSEFFFSKISLIEQNSEEKWRILEEFVISGKLEAGQP